MTYDRDADRLALLEATLSHAAFDGWSQKAFDAGAKDAGIPADRALTVAVEDALAAALGLAPGELLLDFPAKTQMLGLDIPVLRRGGEVRRLTSRKTTRLADAILCATDPAMFESLEDRKSFDRVVHRARSVRYGGDCYTPCLVAAGCADLVVEMGLKPWDVQPLIPIIEAAGGVITSWSGERADTAQSMVVASNRDLHARVVALLNERGAY